MQLRVFPCHRNKLPCEVFADEPMFVTFVVCLFCNIDAMRQLGANPQLCIGNDIGDCVAREIVSRITHFHLDYLSSSPFRNPY